MEENEFFSNKSIRMGLFVAGLLWLVGGAMIGLLWSKLPPELPWFYSLPWGRARLIEKMWLLPVWGGLGGLFVVDVVLAILLDKKELLLRQIFVWGGVVTVLLVFLTLVRIVLIVV